MLAGCGYAKVTSYRCLLYENFRNTHNRSRGTETTGPHGENAAGGELRRISNMHTAPILSQDRTRSLRFEIRKWAEVELKIIRAAAAVVVPRPAFYFRFINAGLCQAERVQALKCNTNSGDKASHLGFSRDEIDILPFPRRIWAPHDPPSFLPAPPACQSPVTSPDGWIPTLVEFSVPAWCSATALL